MAACMPGWRCGRTRSRPGAVVDDATKQLLHARLFDSESSQAVMTALHAVISRHGLADGAVIPTGWVAVHTPKAGGAYIATG